LGEIAHGSRLWPRHPKPNVANPPLLLYLCASCHVGIVGTSFWMSAADAQKHVPTGKMHAEVQD
jgi:hypothetical protein